LQVGSGLGGGNLHLAKAELNEKPTVFFIFVAEDCVCCDSFPEFIEKNKEKNKNTKNRLIRFAII